MADTCLQPGLVGEMMRNALKIEPSSTGILAYLGNNERHDVKHNAEGAADFLALGL